MSNETFEYTRDRVPYLRRGTMAVVELDGGCQLVAPTRSEGTAMLEMQLLVSALEEGVFHAPSEHLSAS